MFICEEKRIEHTSIHGSPSKDIETASHGSQRVQGRGNAQNTDTNSILHEDDYSALPGDRPKLDTVDSSSEDLILILVLSVTDLTFLAAGSSANRLSSDIGFVFLIE